MRDAGMEAEGVAGIAASSSDEGRRAILAILSAARDFDDIRAAGLLFHGTCERLEGKVRGGGYDGIFWAAETPSVAQSYIPRAGVIRLLAVPRDYALEDGLRPTEPGDPIMAWALDRCRASWEELDVETDGRRPVSWRNLPGWPRYADLLDWIARDLGYGLPEDGVWQIACDRNPAGGEMFRPAGWTMPGQLLILHVPDLKIVDPAWSEDGLGLKPHNRLEDFRRFAEAGIDAFHMSDLLQSEALGNVSHRAIGLLPAALERAEWIAIPAARHDGSDLRVFVDPITREFTCLIEALRAPLPDDLSPSP